MTPTAPPQPDGNHARRDGADDPDTDTAPRPGAAGSVRGAAATILGALVRSQIPQRHLVLCLWVLERQFHDQPDDQDTWDALCEGDPHYGWVEVRLPDLCDEFGEKKPNLSDRFVQLCKWRVLERGTAWGYPKHVRLRLPRDAASGQLVWDATTMDRDAARERHARPDAGAPRRVADPDPTVPLEERLYDNHKRAFYNEDGAKALMRETLDDLGRTPDDRTLGACWRAIHEFQTVFNEHFQPKFARELVDLLDRHTAAELVATMADIRANRKYRTPWGYLVRTYANYDTRDGTRPNDRKVTKNPTPTDRTTPTNGPEEAIPDAPSSHSHARRQPAPTGRLARAQARSDEELDRLAAELDLDDGDPVADAFDAFDRGTGRADPRPAAAPTARAGR